MGKHLFAVLVGVGLLTGANLGLANDGTLESRNVSREKFNKLVKVLLDTVNRQKELEEQVIVMQDKLRQVSAGNAKSSASARNATGADSSASTPSKDDSAVDLSALDSNPGAATPGASSGGAHSPGGASPLHINLYFDFYLSSQPGKNGAQGAGFTFNNIHHFFLVEATAGPDIKFMTEIHTSPRFYELDYQFTRWFQLRLGKIWIPFDDLEPHNQFGGYINNSRLRPTASAGTASSYFLPDLWAEMGLGGKFNLVDREKFSLEGHLYVVNGFGSGGTDPVTATNTQYPNFADSGIETIDNNRAKSVGTRLHALVGQTLGLGWSYYTGRWTDEDKTAKSMSIMGLDAQLFFNRAEFRFGYSNFYVNLPSTATATTYHRPGYYAEASYKMGAKRNWKALLSTGGVDGDDRILNVDDRLIYGGKLLYRPNNIEWGIEHFRDLRYVAEKDYRSFTAFRVIAMF